MQDLGLGFWDLSIRGKPDQVLQSIGFRFSFFVFFALFLGFDFLVSFYVFRVPDSGFQVSGFVFRVPFSFFGFRV